MTYQPQDAHSVIIDFDGKPYDVPDAHNVIIDLDAVIDNEQRLSGLGFDSLVFGATKVSSETITLRPTGFSYSQVEKPALFNKQVPIYLIGFVNNSVVGRPSIINKNQTAYLKGFLSSDFSKPTAYNLKQYLLAKGENVSRYGQSYLQGGVKYLEVKSYDASRYGFTIVINTTADQQAKPTGVNSLVITQPTVSPRMLYATGVSSQAMGKPDVFSPVIMPDGFKRSVAGTPTIWFHTRALSPSALLAYESGYLRIADPTQFVQAPSLVESAIFGDTAARNLSSKIYAPAINDGVVTEWAVLTNSNRYYSPHGISSLSMGGVSISNKTPSVFVSGIADIGAGTPAIGYRIRQIKPTGFDKLLLGRATLTMTPELKARGHEDSVFSKPTVWYKNRGIALQELGFNSERYGSAIAWFRYRVIKPAQFIVTAPPRPSVTHGVRKIEAQGFRRDVVGTLWISQGTRYVEPTSIFKNNPTNHLVGGLQEISPQGYVATLFGERIIPVSQQLYPQGFVGQWGLARVDLHTQIVMPVGYITVGQQPADKWGSVAVFNRLQYITQDYDGDNGLVPPKWSGWTLIESRNKNMGVTGFLSSRFGYSQIDNNAAPLLPIGISPPIGTRFDVSMVSHAIRRLTLDGIEAPYMSNWGVVYNGARVLLPSGDTHTLTGMPVVFNTRRYYQNIGAIDSLSMSEPAIGYRIRTIDIEPRYSIAPPQIDLPTVDLWTRYVEFRGYETVGYGTATLSIKFNIIGPSWAHREKLGQPALRNDTPEYFVYGHDSSEFGDTKIRTQWRDVYAQGDTATLFGALVIGDSKRTIDVRGWRTAVSSQLHAVTQTGSPPYSVQSISLDGWFDTRVGKYVAGNGIYFDEDALGKQLPRPSLNQNVLYHKGSISLLMGRPIVYSNNLVVDIGIFDGVMGSSLTVANKVRTITLTDKNTIPSSITVGTPRLSPHTIYAVMDAPQQAKQNHPSKNLHYVDWSIYNTQPNKFGKANVEGSIRAVYPSFSNFYGSKVGEPALTFKTNYISPNGFRRISLGIPSIPFTPQTIDIKQPVSHSLYGAALIGRPAYTGPQIITIKGLSSYSYGLTAIDNLVRYLSAKGADSLNMGVSRANDSPFMWQGLRIGEYIPLVIGGGELLSMGEHSIGLRVRDIAIDGFIAFRSEYDLTAFDKRMRVVGTQTGYDSKQVIGVSGFSSEVAGYQDIKLGQHYIRPDGNSDQFRKGGYHA